VNRTEALEIVKDALARIVPDADFSRLGPDAKFRDALELDSLDFLGFVETLIERTALAIDEDDYPALTTLSSSADFLVTRAAGRAGQSPPG
jgi:acyl carrier protein